MAGGRQSDIVARSHLSNRCVLSTYIVGHDAHLTVRWVPGTAVVNRGLRIETLWKERRTVSGFSRRQFGLMATAAVGAASLAACGSSPEPAAAEKAAPPPAPQHNLNAVKQIRAGDLNVGYVEAGPADGTPVVLLHGWPYDIHSYADVAPALAARRGCAARSAHAGRVGATAAAAV